MTGVILMLGCLLAVAILVGLFVAAAAGTLERIAAAVETIAAVAHAQAAHIERELAALDRLPDR